MASIRTRSHDPVGTQAAILDAAETHFAAKGFAATSMRDLAEASGTSKALIHHHFGSKEALYAAVKQRVIQRYLDIQRPQLNFLDSPAKFIAETTWTLFRFCRENPTLVRLGAWAHLEGDQTPWPGGDEMRPLIMQRIREAQANGILRSDLAPELLVAALVAMVVHWWQYKQVHADRFQDFSVPEALDEQYFEQVLKIFLHGVTGPAFPNEITPASVFPSEPASPHDVPAEGTVSRLT